MNKNTGFYTKYSSDVVYRGISDILNPKSCASLCIIKCSFTVHKENALTYNTSKETHKAREFWYNSEHQCFACMQRVVMHVLCRARSFCRFFFPQEYMLQKLDQRFKSITNGTLEKFFTSRIVHIIIYFSSVILSNNCYCILYNSKLLFITIFICCCRFFSYHASDSAYIPVSIKQTEKIFLRFLVRFLFYNIFIALF